MRFGHGRIAISGGSIWLEIPPQACGPDDETIDADERALAAFDRLYEQRLFDMAVAAIRFNPPGALLEAAAAVLPDHPEFAREFMLCLGERRLLDAITLIERLASPKFDSPRQAWKHYQACRANPDTPFLV